MPTTFPGGGEGGEAAAVEVRLYHCGFEPIEALGRAWIVEPAPFDETTVPDDFAVTGVLTANGDGTATYVDDGGVVVQLTERPPDHEPATLRVTPVPAKLHSDRVLSRRK